MELGWPRERVIVIDEDQGKSGSAAEGRLGFQRLLAEVSLDHVGLILGIEMSRLARSCKDWHQLLELCSVFRTLLADQDGLYDDRPERLVVTGLEVDHERSRVACFARTVASGVAQRGSSRRSVFVGTDGLCLCGKRRI